MQARERGKEGKPAEGGERRSKKEEGNIKRGRVTEGRGSGWHHPSIEEDGWGELIQPASLREKLREPPRRQQWVAGPKQEWQC